MEYGLIGMPLGHSFSKEIHEMLADYTYELHPVKEEDLDRFMKKHEFKAINVTIPYKQKVMPYLDEIDDNARMIGAVNTIVVRNGRLIGHNTDFMGFKYMVEKHNIAIEGKKCLVLGNGGASKAVKAVLKSLGASDIITVYHKAAPDTVTYEEAFGKHADCDVIVNTTPVGMYPNSDDSPVDLRHFPKCRAVLDVIYNPLETKLVRQGRKLGMTGVSGLEMLVAQALYAVEYFLDETIPLEKIDQIYRNIYTEKEAAMSKESANDEIEVKTLEKSAGEVKIASNVVGVIAALAALEVEGVQSIEGGIDSLSISKYGTKKVAKQVKVLLDEDGVYIDLKLNIKYGYSIPVVSKKVQEKVSFQIENMTGLHTREVNVRISGIGMED
ncbi:MAG: Asp23/Gls24 family envelope stress response protein [Lachnospiraceae bacterium]|jgi:shikimate dehydrogenase|nr:Asp23/Gls24 family envelope stress response protein [Lachnospiraceae bacterium]MEE3461009.1 Asp23/Gls24 family envelope stress response protein [Lachnospiraceae bacterium]